jgi:predicted metallopeptidase
MRLDFQPAPDVQRRVAAIVESLGMAHVDPARVVCVRSKGSRARFLARIWPLQRVWQLALGVGPHYVIEVKGERFDELPRAEQDRVLIHELLHVPRNFSGAVLPHRHAGGRVDARAVEALYRRWASEQAERAQQAAPTEPAPR